MSDQTFKGHRALILGKKLKDRLSVDKGCEENWEEKPNNSQELDETEKDKDNINEDGAENKAQHFETGKFSVTIYE